MRILLLEDDQRLSRSYARCLRDEGHAVDVAHTLVAADRAVADEAYDCLVLDRKVPGGDGLDLAQRLREEGGDVPVLVLSAMGQGTDRVEGLTRGADDYLVKPVVLEELALRVAKLTTGRRHGARSAPVCLGRVTMDVGRREVWIDDEPVSLTPTQFSVLEHLLAHRDRAVPTQELLDHVWDRNADPVSHAVHTQINRLRGVFAGVLVLRRVREVGYVVEPAPTPPDEEEAGSAPAGEEPASPSSGEP